jgi:hypothetical protein
LRQMAAGMELSADCRGGVVRRVRLAAAPEEGVLPGEKLGKPPAPRPDYLGDVML